MSVGRSGSVQVGTGTLWALGAFTIFAGTAAILTLAGENRYAISVACLTVLLGVAGWAIGYYRPLFERSLGDLTAMTRIGRDGGTTEHVERWTRILFRPLSPGPLLAMGVVGVLWAGTLITLGPSFTSPWLNVAVFIFFVPIVIVGAWGSLIAIGAVFAVRQTADIDLEAPFSVVRDPVIAGIERGWRTAGFFILVVYVMLLTGFWTGPHGLDRLLVVWLGVFVAFPLVWFVAGGLQLHRMLSALKDENVKDARKDVTRLAEAIAGDSSDVTLQEFNAALDIEAKVQAMPAWPSVPGGIAGFVFAVAPLAIQVSLIYAGVTDSM